MYKIKGVHKFRELSSGMGMGHVTKKCINLIPNEVLGKEGENEWVDTHKIGH